jgi:hypothetical protein
VIEAPMFFHPSAQQLATLLVIVLIIVAVHYLRRLAGVEGNFARLQAELQRMPVYSAETIRHKEAEVHSGQTPEPLSDRARPRIVRPVRGGAWWLWLTR